jgi:cyclohexanone monooxygenase
VLATGFSASDYLGNFRVVGTGGHELHEQWAGEPDALLGMLVPGFPNFFIMYGPNTNSIPLVSLYEEQARFAARTIGSLDRSGRAWVDVSPEWHRRYNRWLQRALSKTVWTQASSYFKAGTGKIVTQWPFSASFYIAALRTARHLALRHGPRTPAAPDVGTQAMASSDRNGSVAPRGLTLKASAVLVFTAIGRLARPRGAVR